MNHNPFFLLYLVHFLFFKGSLGATITLINKCDYTIWPGVLPNTGSPDLGTTGFELTSGGSWSFQATPGWSGRLWARTRCGQDSTSSRWACSTGDCGSGQIECIGSGATTPATLAEFTIGHGPEDHDFYDVSLVDGFNIPMVIEPKGGPGSCMPTGCASDLNQQCPNELRVGEGDACNSACRAFGTPEYCCSGTYASPSTCTPSSYSQIFKMSCPHAYTYAFDDPTSTYTCVGADYTVTCCPSSTSQQKSSLGSQSSTTGGTDFGSSDGSLFGDKCHKKVCIGGGQFLSNNNNNSSKIINHSYFAWQFMIIFIATLISSHLFICR